MITRSPDDATVTKSRATAVSEPPSVEHYRALWGRLNSLSGSPLRTLGLTSTFRGEGVTTVAANLALAATGPRKSRTLLVDANLTSPALHRWFSVLRGPGLNEIITGQCEWKELVQPLELPGLCFLPAGTSVGELTAAADLSRCRELLQELGEHFDAVVVDLPAIGEGGMTLPLAASLDGAALVVEAERVPWEDAQRATQLLSQADARLLGVVLNKKSDRTPRWLRH